MLPDMFDIGKALVVNKSGLERAEWKVSDTRTPKIGRKDARSITVYFGVGKNVGIVEMVYAMSR